MEETYKASRKPGPIDGEGLMDRSKYKEKPRFRLFESVHVVRCKRKYKAVVVGRVLWESAAGLGRSWVYFVDLASGAFWQVPESGIVK